MFKDSQACIRKFVKSDGEIRVMLEMRSVGVVGRSGCGLFGMWDIRGVGCSECEIFGIWYVVYVGCSGCVMFGMWEVSNLGCGMWDVCREVGC